MPPLDNARHEKFAQGLAQGKSASEAYRQAGYEAKGTNSESLASRLSRNIKVASRVAELKERAAASVSLTKEWVLERLIANVEMGQAGQDLAPANKALELLGKELGMFIDRSENLNQNVSYVISGEPVADADEWLAEHRPN
jgi:phage terminase small subunit